MPTHPHDPMALTPQPSDHHTHRPGRGTELKPEQLPTDSAPDQPPWPWTDADLPTPTDQPSNRLTPGQEKLQALQAQSRANQAPAWTRPPRRWALPRRPRPLVIAGCLALAAAGGAVAVPVVISHSASRSVPPLPAAGVHSPVPINPATPAAAAVTPTPPIIPTPLDVAPTPADIPPPPGPNPPAGTTTTAPPAAVVPAPPATDHQVTNQRSPTAPPAGEHPPVPADQPPNDPPDRAGDPQPAPASPPCATDCTQPTLTKTPTHWSPDTP
ncbi:MAG: hypothetical protein WAL99_23460 [Pseudonocardiaceae bacterium]